jgi:hypothetical protein
VADGESVEAVGSRKNRIVNTMKKATKVLGGDLLVVVGFGGISMVNAGTGQVLSTGEAFSGAGLALKKLTEGEKAPAKEERIELPGPPGPAVATAE